MVLLWPSGLGLALIVPSARCCTDAFARHLDRAAVAEHGQAGGA